MIRRILAALGVTGLLALGLAVPAQAATAHPTHGTYTTVLENGAYKLTANYTVSTGNGSNTDAFQLNSVSYNGPSRYGIRLYVSTGSGSQYNATGGGVVGWVKAPVSGNFTLNNGDGGDNFPKYQMNTGTSETGPGRFLEAHFNSSSSSAVKSPKFYLNQNVAPRDPSGSYTKTLSCSDGAYVSNWTLGYDITFANDPQEPDYWEITATSVTDNGTTSGGEASIGIVFPQDGFEWAGVNEEGSFLFTVPPYGSFSAPKIILDVSWVGGAYYCQSLDGVVLPPF